MPEKKTITERPDEGRIIFDPIDISHLPQAGTYRATFEGATSYQHARKDLDWRAVLHFKLESGHLVEVDVPRSGGPDSRLYRLAECLIGHELPGKEVWLARKISDCNFEPFIGQRYFVAIAIKVAKVPSSRVLSVVREPQQ